MKILPLKIQVPEWVYEQIKDLRYETATGFLFWTKRKHGSSRRMNKPVGSKIRTGGLAVVFCNGPIKKTVQNQYLVWFMCNGSFPKFTICHVDGDMTNNRIENLKVLSPDDDVLCKYCNKNICDKPQNRRCRECRLKRLRKWSEENRQSYNEKRKKLNAEKRASRPPKPVIIEKRCNECHEIKSVHEFDKQKGKCKACRLKQTRKRRKENHGKTWKWLRDFERRNPSAKIKRTLRGRIYQAVRGQGTVKCVKSAELLGCSVDELKKYLEYKFLPDMSWDNYGNPNKDNTDCWHIDHIIPCASFDLTDPEQQKKCFHYTNLQPLWAKDNIKKRDKLNWGVA